MTYIVTIVQRATSESDVATTNFAYTSRRSALEKYHSECAYAYNQNMHYALIDVRDEKGAVIRMEIIEEETE